PVPGRQRRGEPVGAASDEGIRPATTAESLARLRPAFAEGGTLTAGNSSQISDGAAALVLTTSARADAEGWQIIARLGANGQTAGPDSSLQAQPADAIARALGKQGLTAADLDLVEINEAFGAVVAHSRRALGVGEEIVNIHGGGIAL